MSATLTLCSAQNLNGTCVEVSLAAVQCINIYALPALFNDLSSLAVPFGFICTLFAGKDCIRMNSTSRDIVGISGGIWPSLTAVEGVDGPQNFDDLTSSLICSPFGFGC
ncbi:hypothetical protein CVT26_006461 [Gymnopilus dilepis]|uniref:Uncharacterized protein n=1 Tax=Gymnopilus dilepis TaxID=231916 RepID=A0A409YTT7_9AGAR|nr:hypothetical protein CVT26_006461 [Gymnopilus dilepis]